MGDAKLKITLTKPGEDTLTYYIDSGDDRIKTSNHTEQEWSQRATIRIGDASGTIAALDTRGYQGVISYGYGANYSACAPLWVVAQPTLSQPESIDTTLNLKGVPDFLNDDKASKTYAFGRGNVTNVKDILNFVLVPSQGYSCFSHCKDYIPVFDSGYDGGENTINTFKPRLSFRISFNESRLSVVKRLLSWTDNEMRIEADGVPHFFLPTTTGETYDEEYQDGVDITRHNFFAKAVRKRIVIPNYIVVSTPPDYETQYTGFARDTTNDGDIEIRTHYQLDAESNAECTSLATGILSHSQLDAERGSGQVPMNCLQEVFDYVKITDSWVGDTRVGNIGYITRNYNYEESQFEMVFGFGRIYPRSPLPGGSLEELRLTVDALEEGQFLLWDALEEIALYLEAREKDADFLKVHIKNKAIAPVDVDF